MRIIEAEGSNLCLHSTVPRTDFNPNLTVPALSTQSKSRASLSEIPPNIQAITPIADVCAVHDSQQSEDRPALPKAVKLVQHLRISDEIPPIGLSNRYLNCYFNSTVQCLFAAPGFLLALRNDGDGLATDLLNLYSVRRAETIYAILCRVMDDIYGPNCAHVLFLNLINALAKESGVCFLSLFEVIMEYSLICSRNHLINTSTNKYLSLSLPLPKKTYSKWRTEKKVDISDCFSLLNSEKNITYPCEECDTSDSKHIARISKLSFILVIHFQRYYNEAKDNRCVNFTEIIKYDDWNYSVFGIVYHIGSLHNGHYYACVKRGTSWYCVDDENVIKLEKGMPKCDGAYLVFCQLV